MTLKQYKILTHLIFFSLFTVKYISVHLNRIDLGLYIIWILPLLVFYFYISKLYVRAYQWFCFFLLIYFLSSSLRVFGTHFNYLDISEFVLICILFIHMMFGPKKINS
ncbi:MAG: hypothetical protein CMD80_01725 [Gammaproteobacteria bacterium]|nr:hypothetical protein [Gammaproteobacteria bacterium]